MTVWERDAHGVRRGEPVFDATSTSGAVEVGGGPWWDAWKADAAMASPVKALLNLPVDVEALADMVPGALRPPGL